MVGANSSQSLPPATQGASLRAALADAHPLYVLPEDPVTQQVLIPGLKCASSLDVMMGYFSSSSLSEISSGLATFLRSTKTPLRMVISPSLTPEDYDAVTQGEDGLSRLAQRILVDDIPDEHAFVRQTLECFAWLLTQNRLILKIALMRQAQFHSKVWLMQDKLHMAALHGSSNLTMMGLSRNREQLTLSRDWKGNEAIYHIKRLRREFDKLWAGGDLECRVLPLPKAVADKVVTKFRSDGMPHEFDWMSGSTYRGDSDQFRAGDATQSPNELKIPTHLVYEKGDFAHQGRAIRAWEASGRRGILEMATGAGKTKTSMICATNLQNDIHQLLVVVSAPYRPLVEQWCDEITEFGICPSNLVAAGGPGARNREVRQAGRRLRMRHSRCEVLVVSNDTLCTENFRHALEKVKAKKLLIADECHNLGTPSFLANPPEVFNYRLGLSATPIRQYDTEGTEALIAYLGEICFRFTLEDAIGKCLTEYDYHVHFAELTTAEMDEGTNLTEQIARQAWKLKNDGSDPQLDNLLRKRRLVLETASAKLVLLSTLLGPDEIGGLRYGLIYATDKDPVQLECVNRLLKDRGVLFHQLTQEETRNRSQTKRILSDFQDGVTKVLTAKRVLDEGVNIPQIEFAYILASTTVRRQWTQRRGRLLRKCSAIGKTHAVIHDFVTLPPSTRGSLRQHLDADARRLVRSELDRIWEFARLSRNGPSDDGPYDAVQYLQALANELAED